MASVPTILAIATSHDISRLFLKSFFTEDFGKDQTFPARNPRPPGDITQRPPATYLNLRYSDTCLLSWDSRQFPLS